MIYAVTLNPTLDRTLRIEHFQVGGTFKAAHSELLPAGKGINVARVAATLGSPVGALGLVGENEAAMFGEALARAGIENRLSTVPGATRASVTVLDPALHTETHLREPGWALPPEAMAQIRSQLEQVREGDWVVFAGSLPPGLAEDTYQVLIRLCAVRGARTLLDANGPPLVYGAEAPPTVVKPNLFELWQIDRNMAHVSAERDLDDVSLAEIVSAARRVQRRGVATVVVSLGERGALGLGADERVWWAQVALDEPVVDAVGSGDALVGGFVAAMARGDLLPEALRLGVACGAANTLIAGAGRICIEDVERLAKRAHVEEKS